MAQIKNKHKEKVRIARRITGGRITYPATVNQDGHSVKISPFNNPVWNERRNAIADRIERSRGIRLKNNAKSV